MGNQASLPEQQPVPVLTPRSQAAASHAAASSDELPYDDEVRTSLAAMDEYVQRMSQAAPLEPEDEPEPAAPDPPAGDRASVAEAKRLRAQKRFEMIQGQVKTMAVARTIAGTTKLSEPTGSDAVRFGSVPLWISFSKIAGFRYRLVTGLRDPDDEFAEAKAGVTFFGHPGASGWADKIGDVAVHYMGGGHHGWCVFSRVFPFPEQNASMEAHEDVLLLGSSAHVMLTPMCAYAVDVAGLRGPRSTPVECLTSEGSYGVKLRTLGKLSEAVRHRLYLTWGHGSSDYLPEVGQWRRPLSELLESARSETLATRARRYLRQALTGRVHVAEQWERYPGAPFDPQYYSQLLASTCSMSEDEERARAVMEARPPADRSSTADADAADVRIDVPPAARGPGGTGLAKRGGRPPGPPLGGSPLVA